MSTTRYAYFNARLSLFAGRLLPAARMQAALERTPQEYVEAGEASLESLMLDTRGSSRAVEHTLLSRLLEDFRILVRPLGIAERAFLVWGLHWFELANLKTIIRAKLTGLSDISYREDLADLGPFATLPLEALVRTEDPAELLRLLEATPYAPIARQARRTLEGEHDLFAVDAAIDRHYLEGLKRRAQVLPRGQRYAALLIVGCVLDRVNLVWMLRFRFAYGLSPAETYYLLVPSVRTLNSARLQALVQIDGFERVLDALTEPMRGWLAGSQSVTEVEDRLDHYGQYVEQETLRDIRHPVARGFAYLLSREREMRRILAIAKGKRLGFDAPLMREAARLAS